MEVVPVLAILAGVLQAVGYAIYIWQALRSQLVPNATSWLMFAYGTLLLTVLEFDLDAHWQVLVLPTVCSFCAVIVSIICRLKQGRWGLPEEAVDWVAFGTDLGLTATYVSGMLAARYGLADAASATPLAVAVLVATNASTVVAFMPILRSVWQDPGSEHWLPWIVWSAAYATLLLVTFLTAAGSSPSLFIYPVICLLTHGLVALLALRGGKRIAASDLGRPSRPVPGAPG
jgi:hypothetical protein